MGLSEVFITNPKLGLFVAALAITFVSTLAQKFLTDQVHLAAQKARQKELQKELKGCKDPKRMSELNSEMLQITGTMFKSSMKPLLFTFIPFIIIFAWLRNIYVPVMGNSWFWYYVGFSILSSLVLRKALKVA